VQQTERSTGHAKSQNGLKTRSALHVAPIALAFFHLGLGRAPPVRGEGAIDAHLVLN